MYADFCLLLEKRTEWLFSNIQQIIAIVVPLFCHPHSSSVIVLRTTQYAISLNVSGSWTVCVCVFLPNELCDDDQVSNSYDCIFLIDIEVSMWAHRCMDFWPLRPVWMLRCGSFLSNGIFNFCCLSLVAKQCKCWVRCDDNSSYQLCAIDEILVCLVSWTLEHWHSCHSS